MQTIALFIQLAILGVMFIPFVYLFRLVVKALKIILKRILNNNKILYELSLFIVMTIIKKRAFGHIPVK